ncbi:FecR family protein [Pseudoxanthomonas sp. 3HH-4]|uniref:FecR family protein n=1 Tax=Pseudoxanthomonas sp. 3HH-4 TaxID=1690214 RepID=UPI0011535A85|nr:FecR domain-containing protein [Pseudoxanthomonas sp. 3HH-4]TQM17897.1 FecR family protein [Pseudoxanthomonas sp. 3HH-4]
MATPLFPPGASAATRDAAHWHVMQREGALSPDDQQRFMAWLVASPVHLREYLAIARVAAEIGDAVRGLPADSALPDERDNVVPLPLRPARPLVARTPPRRLPRIATAAALLLGIGIAVHVALPSTRHYVAGQGAPRVVTLEDGTVMHLNAESDVTVTVGLLRRRIELARGQASFVVAADRRPFTVRTVGLEVRDIGTTFDVSLQRDQARFGVAEGRIHVVDRAGKGRLLADLAAGQSARVAYADHHVSVVQEDVAAMTAWWQRRVVFRDEPLRDIADRFNRMNTVRLHVDDSEAGALRLTGNLRADDLASLRAFLDEQPTLAVSADAREIRVRSRRAPVHGPW